MMRTSPKILRSFLAFSLLFGTLFVPAQVEAGFFSSFFGIGDQAFAETNSETPPPSLPSSNSQSSILALQVNDSSQTRNGNENDSSSTTDASGTALVPSNGDGSYVSDAS